MTKVPPKTRTFVTEGYKGTDREARTLLYKQDTEVVRMSRIY